MHQHIDYRVWLNEIIDTRKKKNPRYSLRAFSKSLNVPPSLMSEVLSGKRRLTNQKAAQIASALFSTEEEVNFFRLLVQSSDAKNPKERNFAIQQLKRLNSEPELQQEADRSEEISSILHQAVLESFQLTEKFVQERFVSQKLQLSPQQKMKILEDLCSAGYLTPIRTPAQELSDFQLQRRKNWYVSNHYSLDEEAVQEDIDLKFYIATNDEAKKQINSLTNRYLQAVSQVIKDYSLPVSDVLEVKLKISNTDTQV